jgi:uncharacterized protein
MTRDPVPGTTKTRLIPALGEVGAARLHAAMVTVTLARARSTSLPVRVALAGDIKGEFAAALVSAGFPVEGQAPGDLGARLHHALRGPGRRIAVGTDCPIFEPSWLVDAARAITPVAFGPAEDGGYWCVSIDGTGGPVPTGGVFRGIPWSTPDTLSASIEAAQRHGLAVSLLPICYDIDTPHSLARLAADPRCPSSLLPLLPRA